MQKNIYFLQVETEEEETEFGPDKEEMEMLLWIAECSADFVFLLLSLFVIIKVYGDLYQ